MCVCISITWRGDVRISIQSHKLSRSFMWKQLQLAVLDDLTQFGPLPDPPSPFESVASCSLVVISIPSPSPLHSFHSSLTSSPHIPSLHFSKWPSGCERQKNEKARDFDFSSSQVESRSVILLPFSAARAVPCFSVPCSVSPSPLAFLVSDGAGRPPRPIWPRPSGQSSSSRKERKGGNANARKKRSEEWRAGKEGWVRGGRGKEKEKEEEGKQALARSQNHDKCKQPAQGEERSEWTAERRHVRNSQSCGCTVSPSLSLLSDCLFLCVLRTSLLHALLCSTN